jgi:hypothetical protein
MESKKSLLTKNVSKKLLFNVLYGRGNVFTTVNPITNNIVTITYNRLNLPLNKENRSKYEEEIKNANINLISALKSDLLSCVKFTCFGKSSIISSPNALQLAIEDAKNKNNENIINNIRY